MESPLPTFAEVVASIKSPKPPLTCRVVEFEDGAEKRSARVIFDGLSGWFVEDDARVEFRSSDDRVLLYESGVLRALPGAHSNGWVKTPIQGRRMSLEGSTGNVIDREDLMVGLPPSPGSKVCGAARTPCSSSTSTSKRESSFRCPARTWA